MISVISISLSYTLIIVYIYTILMTAQHKSMLLQHKTHILHSMYTKEHKNLENSSSQALTFMGMYTIYT